MSAKARETIDHLTSCTNHMHSRIEIHINRVHGILLFVRVNRRMDADGRIVVRNFQPFPNSWLMAKFQRSTIFLRIRIKYI